MVGTFAEAFTHQLDAVGFGDEPIQDGIGYGRLVQVSMPFSYGELGDDYRGGPFVAVFHHLEQYQFDWVVMACSSRSSRISRQAFYSLSNRLTTAYLTGPYP